MGAIISGGKILGTMAASGFLAVLIDNTTNVPLVWLVGGTVAIAGGCWKIASRLQSIEDRIKSLETRNTEKDAREESRTKE